MKHGPRSCPICGRDPKWVDWKVPFGKALVILRALKCDDGMHCCMTSYSIDKVKVLNDWERLVKEKECKLKGDESG
jgi:hypothetical protein